MPAKKSDLPVGRIVGVFGIKGELKCDPSSAGRTLFSPGAALVCRLKGGEEEDVRVSSVRDHKGRLLVRINDVTDTTLAERFVGSMLFASASDVELAPGEYLDRDLVGCRLLDEHGVQLGVVERVEHYPGSDMLVVNGRMVPMVKAFVRSIDIEKKSIEVGGLPLGLLDDDEAERA
jgi:16S rRNA processing protein RimM